MASTTYDLKVKISADNQASAEFSKLWKQAENLQKQSFQWSKSTESALKKVWATATVVAWSMLALWKSFIDASIENEPLQRSFERLSESANISADEMLKAMRRASRWTVADTQLMASANKAYSLWIVSNTEDMATMMEIARVKWQAMWRTMEEALDDIVTWLWRWSVQILDNLWIVIKQSEAQEIYAKQLWKTVNSLTEAEKKQALVNAVVLQWKKELEASWEVQETMQERIARMNAQWENMKNTLGDALIPVFDRLLQAVTPIIEKVVNWIEENPKLTAWIFTAITAVAWLTAVLSGLALALPTIMSWIALLSWPIWWIIAWVTALWVARANNWWWIQEKTKETVDKITEIIQPRIDKLQKRWYDHRDAVMEVVWGLWDWVQKTFGAWIRIVEWLLVWLFQAIDVLLKVFEWDWEWAWQWIKDMAINFATTMDEALTTAFWQTWQSIKDGIQSAYDWCVDKCTSLIQTIKNIVAQIKDAWNSAKDTVTNFSSNAMSKAKSLLSFGWWKADGWMVNAWTTYLVWERWPELFVPNRSGTIVPNEQIINNDNWINITMWSVVVRNDADIKEIAQEIVRLTKLEKNYWII